MYLAPRSRPEATMARASGAGALGIQVQRHRTCPRVDPHVPHPPSRRPHGSLPSGPDVLEHDIDRDRLPRRSSGRCQNMKP